MRYLVCASVLVLSGCAGSMTGLGPGTSGPEIENPAVDPVEPSPEFSDSPYAVASSLRPWSRPDDLSIIAPEPEVLELPPPPKPEVKPTSFGTTVASLGNPGEAGIWIKTPLVSKRQKGKITAANGKEVVADLIPIDGPSTAGSRMSLQAFQALGLSLTDLPEVALSPL